MRSLGRRVLSIDDEIAPLDAALTELVTATAPAWFLALVGALVIDWVRVFRGRGEGRSAVGLLMTPVRWFLLGVGGVTLVVAVVQRDWRAVVASTGVILLAVALIAAHSLRRDLERLDEQHQLKL
jgi:hypothetical protein